MNQKAQTTVRQKQNFYLCPTCGSKDLEIEPKIACCLSCGKLLKGKNPKKKLAKKEILPYHQKLQCKICNGIFPSYFAFSKHYLLQHKDIESSDLPEYKLSYELKKYQKSKKVTRGYGHNPDTPIQNYKFITIDGQYIENRKSKCKTKEVHFIPRWDWHKTIESYNNASEILDKAQKTIIQKCGLRVCPKCSSHRFNKLFKRYYPFLKRFKFAKFVCFEIKKHYPLSTKFKKRQEQNFRNFLRNLERAMHKHPEKFIQKNWIKRKMRAGAYDKVQKTIRLYKNCRIQYLRGLGMVEKRENFYYWHFHCVFNMPYIKAEYLAKRWKEQTGSSIQIQKIGPLSKEEEKKFKKSKAWKRLRKEYPNEKEEKLRVLWYIVKYIAKMETWLSPDQYARFAYGKNFIEKSHSLTKLGYKGTSRQNFYAKITLSTGEILKIPLVFAGVEPITGKPPPKKPKNLKLSSFRPAAGIEKLKKELIKKNSLDLKYAQKHYGKKVINQLSQKGLILKTFSKIRIP